MSKSLRWDERNWNTGRFTKSQLCDGCNRPVGVEYCTDDEVCGASDGPGFYLCKRQRCMAQRHGRSVAERRALYERTRGAR